MKIQFAPSLRVSRGFTLVVTLTLMILLTLIAVGLLSLSSISLRTGTKSKDMAEARANARLALMIALNDLQKYAGPDQRITAPAALGRGTQSPPRPFTKNLRWTGVWSTTALGDPTKPMVGANTDLTAPGGAGAPGVGYLTDRRNLDSSLTGGLWNNKLRLAWLVSGNNPTPSASATINKVKLVSTGSIGAAPADPVGDPVTVPLMGILASGSTKPTGGYAYWVGDENAKAKIPVTHPYAGKTPNPAQGSAGGYYRLAGAEPPNISNVKSSARTPYAPVAAMSDVERQKLATFGQISLAGADSDITPADLRNNYFDLSAWGMSVHSNPRRGGLQKDLTTLLEQERTGANRGVAMSTNPLKLEQVMPETPIIDGAWHKFTGPRFDHLYAWYRLMDELSGSQVGQYSLTPRYLDARQAKAERGINEGWTVNHLAGTAGVYAKMPALLQPRLVDFKLHFDFTRDAGRAGGRAIRSHAYPRLVLWNPYNVRLSSRRYVVMAPFYEWGNLQVGGSGLENIAGDPNSGNLFPGATNGYAFTVEATEFEPGECLVFTPKASASGGPMVGGNSALYDGTDISKNVLSAKKPSDRQNFYFQSGKKILDSVDLTNPQIPYGVNGDVNSSIATGQLVFLLKRAPDTGTIAPVKLYQDKDYATICRHVCHYQGHGDYFWWYVPNMSTHPVNDAPSGFITHESNPERNPPRLWYTEARQRWFDESMEQGSLGQQWGKGSAVWYHLPLIASYNVRAPLVHRSQFCFYDDWTRYSPAGFMIPWASERTFGTPKEAPFVGGKALGTPWGLAGDWAAVAGRYPMFDLPSPDVGVFSLAAFQHAEIGFQSWLPSYIIGHSLSEARSDRDATAKRSYLAVHPGAGSGTPAGPVGAKPWDVEFRKNWTATWHDLIQAADQPNELLAYDIAFETNHYLWDDYFLSTIPFLRNSSTPKITWNAVTPLPNSRQVVNPWLGMERTELAKKLTTPPSGAGYRGSSAYPFHHAAAFLLNDGGFNINSTSVEAWRAVLSSCSDLTRPTMAGGGVSGVNFSRLLAPQSAATNGNLMTSAGWNGTRVLTDAEVTSLAKEIVAEVKLRGPFLSMADFVNRRLGPAVALGDYPAKQDPLDMTIRGPLQAAIEHANLNQTYQQSSVMYAVNRTGKACGNGSGGFVTDYDAMPDSKAYGLPGYLTQADILQRLGPNLTVRGDTFVIRGYGEKVDAQGVVVAKAWCEAVVQRLPEYVEGRGNDDYSSSGPGNHPTEPLTIVDSLGNLTLNDRITPINKLFGRKFIFQSFRWLHSDEI